MSFTMATEMEKFVALGVCIYNTIMINYHYAAMPYYSMI